MKRQVIGLLVVGAMLFSGCGSKAAPEQQETKLDETAEAPEEVQEAAETDAAADEEARGEEYEEDSRSQATEEPEIEAVADSVLARPQLEAVTRFFYKWDEEDSFASEPLLSGHDMILKLTEASAADYAGLDAALYQATSALCAQSEADADTYAAEVKAQRTENELYENMSYTMDRDYLIRRADTQVVSLLVESGSYLGGAHGYTSYTAQNYDTQTGRLLTIADVATDTEALTDQLSMMLLEQYGEALYEDYQELLRGMVDGDAGMELTFTLDPCGVTFFFSPYDLAPYAVGTLDVMVPYTAGIIRDDYAPAAGDGYVMAFPAYESQEVDLGRDGVVDTVAFYYEREDGYVTSVHIVINGEEYTQSDPYAFSATPYLVTLGDGRDYLYVDAAQDNDYRVLYIFDLSDETVRFVDAFGGAFAYMYVDAEEAYRTMLTDPDRMLLSRRMDLLSTFDAYRYYHVGQDGMPESEEPYYTIARSIVLTSKADIICTDATGDSDAELTIPAGSRFTLQRTDGETIVDAYVEDYGLMRLVVTNPEDGWGPMVNEKDAFTLFEELYFAG